MNPIYTHVFKELNDGIEETLYLYLKWGVSLRPGLFVDYREAGRANANIVHNSIEIEI